MKSPFNARHGHLKVIAALLIVAAATAESHPAWAQGNLFGGPRPVVIGGIGGWVLARQAMFYQELAGMIRAARDNGSALWGLMGISFVYGIFHAAGPGHGKAVISSYLFANEETWRRGIALSLASAVMQSLTAIAIVGVAAILFGATAKLMSDTVNLIETGSYVLIVLLGARLLWVKGCGFFNAFRDLKNERSGHATGSAPHTYCDHSHDVSRDLHDDAAQANNPAPAGLASPRREPCIFTATATITTMRSLTYYPGVMATAPSQSNWRDRAAGSAACPLWWPSVCGRAPVRSSCWCSLWRRACSGLVSLRPS